MAFVHHVLFFNFPSLGDIGEGSFVGVSFMPDVGITVAVVGVSLSYMRATDKIYCCFHLSCQAYFPKVT